MKCPPSTLVIQEYELSVTSLGYLLTVQSLCDTIPDILILQTVEAEITAMMPLQRACDAENQARNKLSNGPLRAQSNENSQSILRR